MPTHGPEYKPCPFEDATIIKLADEVSKVGCLFTPKNGGTMMARIDLELTDIVNRLLGFVEARKREHEKTERKRRTLRKLLVQLQEELDEMG